MFIDTNFLEKARPQVRISGPSHREFDLLISVTPN